MATCVQCSNDFTPKRPEQTYCSRGCFARSDEARNARRASMQRRRANGEIMGRQLQKARLTYSSDLTAKPSHPSQKPSELREKPATLTLSISIDSPAEKINQDGLAWEEAGKRYEQIAERLLAKDKTTLILAGYGAGLRVERDSLVVKEGATHDPQTPATHTLYRGMHGIKQIICLDASGSLSFQAIQWAARENIHIALMDRNGGLLQSLTPESPANASLRRCQYRAQDTGKDIELAARLLKSKIHAQWGALNQHRELSEDKRARAMDDLQAALQWLAMDERPTALDSIDGLMTLEARCARAYFAAWAGLPLRWQKADCKKIPLHWLSARERNSPISSQTNARHAADPTNAMLNYAYAVLESQCRLALNKVGADVACGILHSDKDGRDSLVYDVMECSRPGVDSLVLDFITATKLHYGDITPVSDGSCRLHPQLARAVVAACRVKQDTIDEHVRTLARMLLEDATQPVKLRPHRQNKRWVYQ